MEGVEGVLQDTAWRTGAGSKAPRLQGSKPSSCEGPCRAAVLVSRPAAPLQYESIAAEIPSVMENMPCPSDTHLLHTKGP